MKKVTTTIALLLCLLFSQGYSQTNGTISARALILSDDKGHTVRIIPQQDAAPGEYVYEIPLTKKRLSFDSPTGIALNPEISALTSSSGILGSQKQQANLDNEPFITFGNGTSNMTNNRVATEGNGINITVGNGDNGAFTIANTGVLSLSGTTNQVNVNNSTGNVTLSLPQSIHSNATPTFNGLTLDNLTQNSTQTRMVVTTSGGQLQSRTLASLGLAEADEPIITFGNGSSALTNNRVLNDGVGINISIEPGDNGDFFIENDGVVSVAGTANQVSVSASKGNVTFSLPQNIHTNAIPRFNGLTLDNLTQNSTQTRLVVTTSGGSLQSRTISSLGFVESDEPIITFRNGSSSLTNNRVLNDGVGINIDIESGDNGDIFIENDGVLSVAGTANQVSVSASKGNVTFSLPQNIHSNATPTFNGLTLDNMTANSTQTRLVVATAGGTLQTRTLASVSLIDAGEPIITFGSDNGSLSNNRLFAAGAGLGVTIGAGDDAAFTVSNTGVLSTIAGSGIAVSGANGDVTISNTGLLSASAGNGVSVTTTSGNAVITNTGLLSAVAGSGIGVSVTDGVLTISNQGIEEVNCGAGLSMSSSGTSVTLTNTGVLSATAAAGITLNSATGDIVIGNSGVLSNTGGAGISVSGSNGDVTISNTGVLSAIAGTGILVSGANGDVTITNNGLLSASAGAGIGVSTSGGNSEITNTGVLSVIAGTGIAIDNSTGNSTISNTGVTSVALAMPDIFSVANSPVTTTGTLDVTLADQAEHTFFAAPISGTGAPTFRAIDNSDLSPIVWTLDGNDIPAGSFIGGVSGNVESFDMRVNGSTRLLLTDRISVQRDNNGDLRGYYSTDMQSERSADNQVASGNYSTVSGGRNNRASAVGATVAGGGTDGYSDDGNIASARGTAIGGGKGNEANVDLSTIGGGDFNTASGYVSSITGGQFNIASDYGAAVSGGISNTAGVELAFVGGGTENNASGVRSVIGGGQGNAASGEYSVIVGGQGNTASGYASTSIGLGGTADGDYSMSTGLNANATMYGQQSHAAGTFAATGDAQRSEFVLRTTTSDDSWTDTYLDGSSLAISIADNTVYTFVADITALSSTGDAGSYQIKGAIKNINGTTSIVGTISITDNAEDQAAWDVDAVEDDANDALLIQVLGADETDIRWVVSLRTTEVTY